jgi:hypothetical protein
MYSRFRKNELELGQLACTSPLRPMSASGPSNHNRSTPSEASACRQGCPRSSPLTTLLPVS